MQIKLSKAQLQAMEQELAYIFNYSHVDMTDKLLAILLHKLYKKCATLLLDLKSHYTFTVSDEIAIALFIYYADCVYNPSDFGDITLKKICNDVEKKYA